MARLQWVGKVAAILLLAALMPGCGPVERPHNIRNVANYYHVHRGDTLHTIAWRFNVDVRDLMAWNRLKPPYTIYPGQRLLMSPPPGYQPPVARKPSGPKPAVASRVPTQASPPRRQPPVATKPSAAAPALKDSVAKAPPAAPVSAPSVTARPTPPKPVSKPRTLSWGWPLQGRLVKRFDAAIPGRQGIRIRGRNGQAVQAAEAGTVVYSGNGLKGYRELIIIQHSPDFLSAYAQNRKRLVVEGDEVKRGQKIAELGDPHTNAPELHFELRLRGKPVDPLSYLGAR